VAAISANSGRPEEKLGVLEITGLNEPAQFPPERLPF